MSTAISKIIGGALLITSAASAAHAGGLERGGYNWELLFDPSQVATEAGIIYVMPDRKFKNARDINPADGLGSNGIGGGKTSGHETPNYEVPRFGAKLGITPDFDCLGSYAEPWGVHTNPGADWVGANQNIETKIDSKDYGLTCSYKFAVGEKSFIRAIGGVSYQEVEGFKERLVLGQVLQFPSAVAAGFDGTGVLDLKGDGWGWRVGASYEMPDYALRASSIYNAEVDLGRIAGTIDVTEIPARFANPLLPFAGRVIDVFGTATMPQSAEFKLQTGIAKDWLAFGTVKWVDWSVLQVVGFCSVTVTNCTAANYATSLDLMFRDGWTISGGVGHKFNEQWSGQVQLSWDRGTSTGLTTQTDTWLLSTGVSYTPNDKFEVRAGGAVGMLTSGEYGPPRSCPSRSGICGGDVAYDFGDDFVGALSLSAKLKF